MPPITAASFAKVNLGLKVFGRRADGYHEIRTCLQTIDLHDELTFEEAAAISLDAEGPFRVPADDTNLVARATRALAERFPGRGARITLRKLVPPGSGLGGGSSNAAVTLMGLDRLWRLQADPGLLYSLAARLGADVPFFLYGGTCLAVGKGDEILPLPDVASWDVLVVWPGVELSTRQVYERLPLPLTRQRILSSMKGFVPGRPGEAAPRSSAGDEKRGGPPVREGDSGAQAGPPAVDNDLEEPAFHMLPDLRRLKERMLNAGAVAASMSGSGSAVFGLWPSSRGLEKVASSLATGGAASFICRTLTRDAYRLKLFERSRT
jgi:4-diphosphocytidyl-2-C-methyl-D-erythritol kinase